MRTWLVTLAILTAACDIARADIPPPPNATRAEIEEWHRAREARDRLRFGVPPVPIALPKSTTKELPFTVIGNGGSGELRIVLPAKLVEDLKAAQSGRSGSQVLGPEQIPTIIAGLALSLAVVTGGLWLHRSRRRLAFGTLAFILATTTVLGIGCIHTKDKTAQDQQAPPPSLVQTPDGKLIGQAALASSDKEEIQVIVDREVMGSFIAASGIKTDFVNLVTDPMGAGK
jgi:hypothetical protein